MSSIIKHNSKIGITLKHKAYNNYVFLVLVLNSSSKTVLQYGCKWNVTIFITAMRVEHVEVVVVPEDSEGGAASGHHARSVLAEQLLQALLQRHCTRPRHRVQLAWEQTINLII